jgi:hypothetical protein
MLMIGCRVRTWLGLPGAVSGRWVVGFCVCCWGVALRRGRLDRKESTPEEMRRSMVWGRWGAGLCFSGGMGLCV